MPRTIHILTPSLGADYAPMAAEWFADYRAILARHGFAAEARPWTEGAGGAPALALLAWGYHSLAAQWAALLESWPADTPLLNPPAMIRWNTRKTYLQDFEAAGVPTVPTIFGDADAVSVAAAFDTLGADELVVKPQVSAGSDRTVRVKRGDAVAPLRTAMIQPFLPAIGREGEYSLFYFGGVWSHAVRKVAADGDFRVQPQFGCLDERWIPDAEARATADAAIASAPKGALYARVDLIRAPDGGLALMEYEAIEPDLYFRHDRDAGDRFGLALKAAF